MKKLNKFQSNKKLDEFECIKGNKQLMELQMKYKYIKYYSVFTLATNYIDSKYCKYDHIVYHTNKCEIVYKIYNEIEYIIYKKDTINISQSITILLYSNYNNLRNKLVQTYYKCNENENENESDNG